MCQFSPSRHAILYRLFEHARSGHFPRKRKWERLSFASWERWLYFSAREQDPFVTLNLYSQNLPCKGGGKLRSSSIAYTVSGSRVVGKRRLAWKWRLWSPQSRTHVLVAFAFIPGYLFTPNEGFCSKADRFAGKQGMFFTEQFKRIKYPKMWWPWVSATKTWYKVLPSLNAPMKVEVQSCVWTQTALLESRACSSWSNSIVRTTTLPG